MAISDSMKVMQLNPTQKALHQTTNDDPSTASQSSAHALAASLTGVSLQNIDPNDPLKAHVSILHLEIVDETHVYFAIPNMK